MKTIMTKAAAALLLAGIAAPALAQGIATIDLNRIFSESAAAKSANTQMQAKYQGTATQQQAALNAAATAYNTQVEAARKVVKPDGSGLTDAQRSQIGQAEQAVRTADEALNRTQQEAQAVGNYVRDQILRGVIPIAEQIRAERKAAAVVPRNQVLAADPAADVTSTVIQRLDQSLKTVSITLPQGQQPAAGQRPATTTTPRPATPQGR